MVRQELASELGVVASLRTVGRSVSHLRRELAAAALATVRFETPPGRQFGIDPLLILLAKSGRFWQEGGPFLSGA